MKLDIDQLAARLAHHHQAPRNAPSEAEEDFRHAAVAVVLSARPTPRVLLMVRAERPGDRWSGQVSFPGGHAEEQDDDLIATAMRETHEELNVDLLAASRVLGPAPSMQARARGGPVSMRVHPFVFELTATVAPRPGPEASEAFWLPLEEAHSGSLDDQYDIEYEGVARTVPCWNYEGRIVWGMTFRILESLLATWHARSGEDA